MPCNLDHSKLTGLRFCTSCGLPLTPGVPSNIPQQVQSPPAVTPQVNLNSGFQGFSAEPSDSAMQPPKNKNVLIFSIAGVTAFLVLVAGIFFVTKSPAPVSVSVSLTLLDQECYDLSWGYFDILGADVELEVDGVTTGYASLSALGNTTYAGCEFTTTFYGIPADGSVYSYSMASGRRGSITKTKTELEADGWSFDLTIG